MNKIMYEITNMPGEYIFWCEGCGCCHRISTHVPNECNAKWGWNGDVYKPTISPSILVTGGPPSKRTICHTFVNNGKIQYLGDCTHHLAGQTVDMTSLDDVKDNHIAEHNKDVYLREPEDDINYKPTTKRKK